IILTLHDEDTYFDSKGKSKVIDMEPNYSASSKVKVTIKVGRLDPISKGTKFPRLLFNNDGRQLQHICTWTLFDNEEIQLQNNDGRDLSQFHLNNEERHYFGPMHRSTKVKRISQRRVPYQYSSISGSGSASSKDSTQHKVNQQPKPYKLSSSSGSSSSSELCSILGHSNFDKNHNLKLVLPALRQLISTLSLQHVPTR
ncbi:hypothetical protein KI387_010659, partial [Taxus chinensis]